MRVGSLCSGYEGLGLAAQDVFPEAELAWVSDIDKGACKILAHRYPDVPNIGDMTTVDWAEVEPVDVIIGGTPCQDLSHAGKRAGMTEGTRSNLWVAMREAIAAIRPKLVIWENVQGAGSAEAASDLEFCAGCMGEAWYRRGPVLRALGRVVGDLSDLGYVGQVRGLRAADVGAPHGRFRYFLAAYPQGNPWRLGDGDGGAVVDAGRLRAGWASEPGEARAGGPPGDLARRGLLPTPTTRDHKGRNQRDDETCLTGALLPTPSVADSKGGHQTRSGARSDEPLLDGVHLLLPTPTSMDAKASGGGYNGQDNVTLTDATVRQTHGPAWGDYAPAIARWGQILGRPAPAPTMTSSKGNPQLAPAFVEWMMGLPLGWVTDVPGLSRNDMLRALGNGVVRQQAAAALRLMLSRAEVAA